MQQALQTGPRTLPGSARQTVLPRFSGLRPAQQQSRTTSSAKLAANAQRAALSVSAAAATAEKPTVATPPTEKATTPMNIVFVSAEVAPWSKVGEYLRSALSSHMRGGVIKPCVDVPLRLCQLSVHKDHA